MPCFGLCAETGLYSGAEGCLELRPGVSSVLLGLYEVYGVPLVLGHVWCRCQPQKYKKCWSEVGDSGSAIKYMEHLDHASMHGPPPEPIWLPSTSHSKCKTKYMEVGEVLRSVK